MSLNTVKILGVSVTSTEPVEVLSEIIEIASGKTYNGAPVIPTDRAEGEEVEESLSTIPAGERDPSASPPAGGFARDDDEYVQDYKKPLIVFTPNPEFLVEARKDLSFRDLLNKADINLPDGVGLIWASRLLGTPIKERISGADMVERLLETGNGKWEVGREVRVGGGSGENKKWVVGIAGARRGVLEESVELIKRLQEKYPRILFVNLDSDCVIPTDSDEYRRSGGISFSEKGRGKESFDPSTTLRAGSARDDIAFNIVFASHGMKEQEEWIWENKDKIPANVFMGIGGSLDFITGFSRRAPMLVQQIGLEWLWRGLQRPSHFKRVWKAVFVFSWLVVKEKFVSARSLLAG